MVKPWKLVLLLVGIFAAGVITGGFVTVRFGRQLLPRPAGPDRWGPSWLKKLTEQLDLTPEQREKLDPIVKRDTEDLARIRSTSFTDTRRILERMDQDIEAILTPEQRTKFDEIHRQMRERMQRFMKDRGWGGGMHGPHEHPPGEPPPGPPPEPPADKPADKTPGI